VTENMLIALDPPILGNPIVQLVDDEIIKLVARALYMQLAMLFSFKIIAYQEGVHNEAYKTFLIALEAAQKKGDKNEIAKALIDFQKACGGLTTFVGAGTPP